ncbi:AbrB/MazE/SpoVT family DNA-binding domain-containing protein [Brevundimonas sp. AJA228-03]|nr:AbrB/MazE/SpoVT family DNA-binding domain-containing protein [Brevundimonas sp. AJA228-03]
MMELTMTSKGQITINKTLRDGLGAKPGQKLRVEVRPDGGLVIPPVRPATKTWDDLIGILKPLPGTPPVSIEEMNETIARGWAGELDDHD